MEVNEIKLTKAQEEVVIEIQSGAVIGEMSDKINGRYELFRRKSNWFPKTCHRCEHPFQIRRLNKNTVFALLEIGLICENNEIAKTMEPFNRDKWYGFTSE